MPHAHWHNDKADIGYFLVKWRQKMNDKRTPKNTKACLCIWILSKYSSPLPLFQNKSHVAQLLKPHIVRFVTDINHSVKTEVNCIFWQATMCNKSQFMIANSFIFCLTLCSSLFKPEPCGSCHSFACLTGFIAVLSWNKSNLQIICQSDSLSSIITFN